MFFCFVQIPPVEKSSSSSSFRFKHHSSVVAEPPRSYSTYFPVKPFRTCSLPTSHPQLAAIPGTQTYNPVRTRIPCLPDLVLAITRITQHVQ
ncbi:hypothetical protein SCLCIDRAFT_1213623 [Scleroderma citrinum Foug A]|uniref:Uncharacterized protein n=1 Tax=Scleroderma citrinum Foug A TaxID=1036808 RepID=A0A0C3AH16_9AGAM|nr:hypothetical protein SCLCIDRAFT_1213623 [Scleroderma citrinum Foug A]